MKLIYILFFASLLLTACAQKPAKISQADVSDKTIQIMPNEKLFVEVIVENGTVIQLKPVAEVVNPAITVTFNFSSFNNGMMLSVQNPFKQALKYNIDMIDLKGKAHQTSSCPVIAGRSVFESWPHPIPKLVIKNLHFLDEEKIVGCVY